MGCRGQVTTGLAVWLTILLLGGLAEAETEIYNGVELPTQNSFGCTNLTTKSKVFHGYKYLGVCFFLSFADDHANDEEVSVLQLSLPNKTMHIGLHQRRVEVITPNLRIKFSQYVDCSSWMLICVSETDSVVEVSIDGIPDSPQDTREENLKIRSDNESSLCLGSSPSALFPSFRGKIVLNQISFSNEPLQLDECSYSYGDFVVSKTPLLNPPVEFDVSCWSLSNDASNFDVPITSVCQKDELQVLIQFVGNYYEHRDYCSYMGGSMAFEMTDKMSDIIRGKCSEHKEKDSLWLATRLDEPPILEEMCKVNVASSDDDDDDYDETHIYCLKSAHCSFCRMPMGKVVYRYGMDDQFDREFSLISDDGILKLLGDSSLLTFKNGEWILQSKLHSRKMILPQTHSPLGRNIWALEERTTTHQNRNFMRNKSLANSYVVLNEEQTFSPCLLGEFCCTNGQCIGDALARCDGFVHCSDRSDEVNCELIEKSEGYVITQSPSVAKETGGIRNRELHLSYCLMINHIAKIYSVNGEIKIDFSLRIVWRDERLVFWNLHSAKRLEIDDVWTPNLIFKAETKDGLTLSVSEESKDFAAVAHNNSTPSQRFNNSYMGYASQGTDVNITMILSGKLTWNCDFQLQFFPFGKHECVFYLEQKLRNKYLSLHFSSSLKINTGVSVNGGLKGKTLGEYLFKNAIDEVINSNQTVKFTLQFQSDFGYYMLNAYFPSLLMFILAYSTFFFPLHNFNERVMVSLTSLLVLTTFFDQLNDSVVHTSYVKMLDAWFAVLIFANFVVVITNVVVNNLIPQSSEPKLVSVAPYGPLMKEPQMKANETSNSANRVNKWMTVSMFMGMACFLTSYVLIAYFETI